ncbi:MAG: hypothetical protein GX455_06075, partial [Phycisphaerae bacterium]|nr:hypothetical protein [Phycisphaerae bacterium]
DGPIYLDQMQTGQQDHVAVRIGEKVSGDAQQIPMGLKLATGRTEIGRTSHLREAGTTGGLFSLRNRKATSGGASQVGGDKQLDGTIVNITKKQDSPARGNL